MRVQTHEALISGKVSPFLVVVSLPLPLRTEHHAIELIALDRCAYWVCLAHVRFLVLSYGLAPFCALLCLSYNGPVVYPLHWLKAKQSAVCAYISKVEEPVLAGWSIYPCSLMRAVYWALSLLHHDARFVRTVDVL